MSNSTVICKKIEAISVKTLNLFHTPYKEISLIHELHHSHTCESMKKEKRTSYVRSKKTKDSNIYQV